MLRLPREQAGFSLVETLAALLVFGIVTLGILPLMLSTMRASNLNRTSTIAKNLVVEATERARGLPFRREISGTDGNPKRVDLLDLYFPRGFGGTAADGVYASNVFTVTCGSGSLAQACPKSAATDGSVRSALPANYTLTFRAEFVQATAGAGGVETYSPTTVPATYYWQGAEAGPGPVCTGCSSSPPSELLRLTVTASWNLGALGNRSFSTTSILGNRRFSGLRLRGAATVTSLIEMSTGFSSVEEGDSSLSITAGAAESDMEVRAVTRARYSGSAGRLLLEDSTEPLAPDVDTSGATTAQEAPPDFDLLVTDPEEALVGQRTDLGLVGGVDDSRIVDVHGTVAVDLPQAQGTTELLGTDTDSPLGLLWMTTQVDTAVPANNPLRLFSASRVAWLEAIGANAMSSTVDSSTMPTTSAATRVVANEASGDFGNLRLFPTDYIPVDVAQPAGPFGGPVIEVQNFAAEVSCRSTANSATAVASATWSATLRVWTDPEDGTTNGGYTTRVINETNATAELTAIGNPMIYEEPNIGLDSPEQLGRVPNDIYLFPRLRTYDLDQDPGTPVTTHLLPGYLAPAGWSARQGTVSADDAGRVTTAALDTALRVSSSPLNPTIPLSTVSVTMGTLNCESVDLRP